MGCPRRARGDAGAGEEGDNDRSKVLELAKGDGEPCGGGWRRVEQRLCVIVGRRMECVGWDAGEEVKAEGRGRGGIFISDSIFPYEAKSPGEI